MCQVQETFKIRMHGHIGIRIFGVLLFACIVSGIQAIPEPATSPAFYAVRAVFKSSVGQRENMGFRVATPEVEHGDQRVMILTSTFSDTDFIPDGNLGKKAWATPDKVNFDQDAFQKGEYPEIETAVASLWTRKYLYLAYRCRYKSLNVFEGEDASAERWELWTRDVVEAFIAPEPSRVAHYYEFEVAPNNQWIDLEIDAKAKEPHNALWNSGFEHATRVDRARHIWTVEMRIPTRSMGVQQITAGSEWRVNLFRADGFGNDNQRCLLSWSPLQIENRSFHQPASFGILKFASPKK
jgi:hypothetical protein